MGAPQIVPRQPNSPRTRAGRRSRCYGSSVAARKLSLTEGGDENLAEFWDL